jgi:hypothetical protein
MAVWDLECWIVEGRRKMLKAAAAGTRDTLLCPSSQPEVKGARVLGVVQQSENGAAVSYLEQLIPVTTEVMRWAAPFSPTEVFRLAAPCQTNRCPHFDGRNCGLATRIVKILPAVVEQLPRCQIRGECRWFRQEGGAACRRCPQISTVNYGASETMRNVIQLAPGGEPRDGVPGETLAPAQV